MNFNSNMWLKNGFQINSALLISVFMVGCTGTGSESSSSLPAVNSSSAAISSAAAAVSSSSSSPAEPVANYDHCLEGFKPHVTDSTISDGPTSYTAPGGQKNATVHPKVYEHMYATGWQDAHVLWHNVRACGALFGETPRPDLPDACKDILFKPEQTTCAGAQDGLEFLAGHRLMLEQLKELWPSHQEQFTGWTKFPGRTDYPDILVDNGYVRDWSSEVLQAAQVGDNIESYLDQFPTEGDLGTWLQCGGGFGGAATLRANLHISLHGNGSPGMSVEHSVNNNNQNLDAYLFWKLHGWIDNVWERYRIAKGKTRSDADYKAEMLSQCREMDHWRQISVASRTPDGSDPNNQNPSNGLPKESGFFHETVRPAIEKAGCLNCHGDIQSNNDLQLGGQISSTEIVENLLGDATLVKNFKYVVPGDLSASWLYMKASGESANANVTCSTGLDCRSPMTYDNDVIQSLKEWIMDHNASRPVMEF